jgi:hypothetical protein
METLGDKLVTGICGKNELKEYYCECCHYKCFKKYNLEKHLRTTKHINATKGDKKVAKSSEKWQTEIFKCEFCKKEYQHRQCLWRHKKNCNKIDENTIKELTDKELIMMLVKQNSEIIKENFDLRKEHSDIKELILEIVKNGTHNTINNTITNTNSHNKAFNLNFFLNETCKNAMNITDFVDSIKLQLSDFMEVGESGFVQGISNIIVKKLNDLDETVRPIHCTDQKRETFYVKDEDKWEKEEEDLKRIRRMINRVASKNEILMHEYKKVYPDYKEYHSKRSDQYSKFVIEALGGNGDNVKEKHNKIINHISKATTIKHKNK